MRGAGQAGEGKGNRMRWGEMQKRRGGGQCIGEEKLEYTGRPH